MAAFYQSHTQGEWGVGIDAVSALDCWGFGMPGFQGLSLEGRTAPRMSYTPAGYKETGGSYTFHFPDGNASIARLLVRNLVPGAVPGVDCRDIVTAQVDYGRLDRPGADVRIRLSSIVCPGAQRRRSGRLTRGRDRLCARRRRLPRPGQGLRPGLLEHDDPLSLPGDARGAEGGPAPDRQDAAGLHQRRPAQLDGVPAAWGSPA